MLNKVSANQSPTRYKKNHVRQPKAASVNTRQSISVNHRANRLKRSKSQGRIKRYPWWDSVHGRNFSLSVRCMCVRHAHPCVKHGGPRLILSISCRSPPQFWVRVRLPQHGAHLSHTGRLKKLPGLLSNKGWGYRHVLPHMAFVC